MFAFPSRAPATRPAQAALERKLLACLGVDEEEGVGMAERWGEEGRGGDHPPSTPPPPLDRPLHAAFLRTGLRTLPSGFVSLSAGRPWIVYWVAHGLNLLGQPLGGADAAGERRNQVGGMEKERPRRSRQALSSLIRAPLFSSPLDAVSFLAACQHPSGGFGGSPGQLPHLAPTFAALSALVSLDAAVGGEALATLDRPGLGAFLEARAVPPLQGGGFSVCQGGEVDTRGAYTALACADLAGLDTRSLATRAGVLPFLTACQGGEGGLAGSPGGEAHGGYTLCGLAAALLAAGVRGGEKAASPGAAAAVRAVLDLRRLATWAARCQSPASGGFAGRTAKLVDGCYSYWQGAAFPLLEVVGGVPAPGHVRAATTMRSLWQLALPPPGPPGEGEGTEPAPSAPAFAFDPATAPPLPPPPPLPAGLASPPGPIARAGAALAVAGAAASLAAAEAPAARAGASSSAAAAAVSAQEAADCARSAAAMAAAGAVALAALNPSFPAGTTTTSALLFNAPALIAWVRACCQGPSPRGGLRDKPGAHPDFYHTCYCLSGLAAVDALVTSGSVENNGEGVGGDGGGTKVGDTPGMDPTTGGPWRLTPTDPLLNVTVGALERARARFG